MDAENKPDRRPSNVKHTLATPNSKPISHPSYPAQKYHAHRILTLASHPTAFLQRGGLTVARLGLDDGVARWHAEAVGTCGRKVD